MEKNYAVIEAATGLVCNVIVVDDESGYVPDDGFIVIQTDVGGIGWTYADGVFTEPPPPAVAPPTAAEILATNTVVRNQLLAAATLAIAPLQDADDLGEATAAETALLKSWKQFRVAVNRIDLTVQNPAWPVAPQTGYGAALAPATDAS
jgi:hypothetical protein